MGLMHNVIRVIMKYKKIGIVADESDFAKSSAQSLMEQYNLVDVENSFKGKLDALVVVGGDGFMLRTLHRHIEDGLPVYGLNMGTIGFLLNEYSENNLIDRVNEAVDTKIHPLKMVCVCEDESKHEVLAINEVSLLRTTGQAAKIGVYIDETSHVREMICDGVLVATPAGSSAYNYSNGGMVMPIGSNLLALTPISAFRPRRWKGALLPNKAKIRFEINKHWKRPVKAVADNFEVENVVTVEVILDTSKTIHLLFDKGHSLEDRIMKEQFEIC